MFTVEAGCICPSKYLENVLKITRYCVCAVLCVCYFGYYALKVRLPLILIVFFCFLLSMQDVVNGRLFLNWLGGDREGVMNLSA